MRSVDRAIFNILRRMPARDEEDGGKGSGNWGHKGRPGLRGGSGKGGVAYSDGHGNLHEGTFMSDYKSPHVTQDERDWFKQWRDGRSTAMRMYGGHTNKALSSAGMDIRSEIERRTKLRKKAKDLPDWNKEGKVQTEDIFDVLRDCRSFGAVTEEAKSKILPVHSELPKERTDAILKEALDGIPTDWLECAEFPVEIRIIDMPAGKYSGQYVSSRYGRDHEGTITIFARQSQKVVKELNLPDDKLTDMYLANVLRHELGHYIEESNYGIGNSCREFLAKRTEKSETEQADDYTYKPDNFFRSYMGRDYYDGSTEILSCCLEALGCTNPAEYMKNGFFGERDTESYKFVLGLLAFKEGGYF